MGYPETSTTEGEVGGWVVLQPGLPDAFTDILDTISSFLQAILAILNIALAVLSIIKAFLAGLLDPLLAIIEAIIREIEALLNDIRQIGIYLAGDWPAIRPWYEDLLGGYTAYERRMIGRLINRADPTRPDFSSRSAVIAIFLYVSVDPTGVRLLIKAIQAILRLFGKTVPVRAFTVPVALQATYGADGATLASFGVLTKAARQNTPPNSVNLRWRMAPAPSGTPIKFPQLAPKGFLIEVSTVPDGLLVAYDIRSPNAKTGEEANVRSYGLVRDPGTGLPFRLYGGSAMIDIEDFEGIPFKADTDGTNTQNRIYAYRTAADNVPIPIEKLYSSGKYLLQRTFYVKAGFFSTMAPGQGFSATLAAEDMPWDAEFEVQGNGDIEPRVVGSEPASTVYVRISAVTEEIADTVLTENGFSVNGPVTALSFWRINSLSLAAQLQYGNTFLLNGSYTPGDKSEPSTPLTVTFPARSTREYLDTVTAALAVLVLSRSDLEVIPDEVLESYAIWGQTPFQMGRARVETGLEDVGTHLVPLLVGTKLRRYFDREGVAPENFRAGLLRRCRSVANLLYSKTGPLGELETLVVEQGAPLLDFRWSSVNGDFPTQSILESLESKETVSGVGLNPVSIGLPATIARGMYMFGGVYITRAPGFLQKGTASTAGWYMDQGSADMSPVVYQQGNVGGSDVETTTVVFCRNALPGEVYGAAAVVLNIAAAPITLPNLPDSGSWETIRLFPQGLPPIEAALDEIIGWIDAIRSGIKGIVAIIIAYIEFLEARILEIQALINRILGLLDYLGSFDLPQMAGLVVTANGTDGILQALVTADNKPSDSRKSYGGGVVLLAGGLPAVLLDILKAFFPEASS